MTSVDVLDERTLNRSVLGRQCLLSRVDLPLPGLLERMGGLQAQYAPSSYVGLWGRRAGMQRRDLDRSLVNRTVVQGTLMRVTIHLVSREDYWPFAVAVRRARRRMWLRLTGGRWSEREMEALADRTRSLLEQGPSSRTEILKDLGDMGNSTLVGVGLWVDLVRVPPSGTWGRRRADLYGLAETWIGPAGVSEEEGIDHLIRRYLEAFGPASVADLASWSGVGVSMLRLRLREIETVAFRDPAGKELIDLPDGRLFAAETPAPVRFLPTWDATLLVHCRRAGILPERYRPMVFSTKNPQSVGTFLVDGRVAGTWKITGDKVKPVPFEPLDQAAEDALMRETERLEAFIC